MKVRGNQRLSLGLSKMSEVVFPMLFRFHFLGALRWLFGWFREVFSVVFL